MSTFSELQLSPYTKERLASAGFTTPTPVQDAAIPKALEGKDVLATAQTGTGKTLAFVVPILEHLLKDDAPGVAALVLLPTRELAMQVADTYDLLRGKRLKPAALIVGGLAEGPQITALRRGARLIVATPGRLEDYLDRRLVQFGALKILVLDEADRMLDMGFLPSIRRIASALPRQRQTLCFSATLEASVAHLVHDYMRHPVRVSIGSVLKPAENIRMQAFEVAMDQKYALLEGLLAKETGRVLIFTRTRRNAERLAKTLNRDGFAAARIHGDRTQSQRTAALSGFQTGRHSILVATDVAARGIHVEDITHVINYDLPEIAENYIHRVGRTARAGREGVASTLITRDQRPELQQLERALGLRMERLSPDSHVADAASRPRVAVRSEDDSPHRGKRPGRSNGSSRSAGHKRSAGHGRSAGPRHSGDSDQSGESGRRSIAPLPGEFLQAQM
jgi:ATP-dependent RNA helicase RhlE